MESDYLLGPKRCRVYHPKRNSVPSVRRLFMCILLAISARCVSSHQTSSAQRRHRLLHEGILGHDHSVPDQWWVNPNDPEKNVTPAPAPPTSPGPSTPTGALDGEGDENSGPIITLQTIGPTVSPSFGQPGLNTASPTALIVVPVEPLPDVNAPPPPTSQPPTMSPTPLSTLPPTLPPTQAATQPPTQAPTVAPTQMPAESPTPAPVVVTLDPSVAPTIAPTPNPTPWPTQRPTIAQTTVPLQTLSEAPTLAVKITVPPSLEPGVLPVEAENETDGVIPLSVPIQFEAELQNPERVNVDDILPQMASVWSSYIRNSVRSQYGDDVFKSIVLVVEEKETTEEKLRLLRRVLADDGLALEANGQLNLEFEGDPGTHTEAISNDVDSFLGNVLSNENLQGALARSDTGVTIWDDELSQAKRQTPVERPSLIEMILGFAILALAVASLIFWSTVLYKKRQKRLRKRKLASLRQAKTDPTAVVGASSSYSRQPRPTRTPTKTQIFKAVSPRRDRTSPTTEKSPYPFTMQKDQDSDESSSPYRGLISDENSDSGSAFGQELRKAASEDLEAWQTYMKQKQEIDQSHESGAGMSSGVSGYSVDDGGVEMVNNRGGIVGIRPAGAFPYGDEGSPVGNEEEDSKEIPSNSSRQGIPLTLENAVGLDESGLSSLMADRYGTQDDGGFEPYGEKARNGLSPSSRDNLGGDTPEQAVRSRKRPTSATEQANKLTFRESWDMDEEESADKKTPAQYSFMFPLKRRELSDQAVASVAESSASSAAIRTSPTVSSWSYAHEGEHREILSDDSADSGDRASSHMLQELADLSKLVRKYDRKKQKKRERERTRGMSPSVESRSISTVQYDAMSDSASSRRVNGTPSGPSSSEPRQPHMSAYRIPQRSVLPTSFESASPSLDMNMTDEEDDNTSHRLGIGRFSIKKPQGPLLSFNNANIDHVSLESPSSAPMDERENYRALGREKKSHGIRQISPGNVPVETGIRSGSLPAPSLDEPASDAIGPARIPQVRHLSVRTGSSSPGSPSSSRSPRSKDKGFNRLFSMFESKPKTAVTPPNATVRFVS